MLNDRIAIDMGAFDGPTGTALTSHIFVMQMGDYYNIADVFPQSQRQGRGVFLNIANFLCGILIQRKVSVRIVV